MSREHYCITLIPKDAKMGNSVTIFIDHIVSLHPQADSTCVVECIKGEHHVRESEATIIQRCAGHNTINKVGN
jgi:hypothetical protein